MAGDQLPSLKVDSYRQLDKRSKSATLMNNLKYLVGKEMAKVSNIGGFPQNSWSSTELTHKMFRHIEKELKLPTFQFILIIRRGRRSSELIRHFERKYRHILGAKLLAKVVYVLVSLY